MIQKIVRQGGRESCTENVGVRDENDVFCVLWTGISSDDEAKSS